MSDTAPPKPLPPGFSFRINEDGSVTFDGLPPDLLDVVLALDDEAALVCDIPPAETDGASPPQGPAPAGSGSAPAPPGAGRARDPADGGRG